MAATLLPLAWASGATADAAGTPLTVSYDPSIALDREQLVTVTAWAGTFTLAVGADITTPLPATATAAEVEAALEALPAADLDGSGTAQLTVTGGTGGVLGGYHYRIRFDETAGPTGYPHLVATNVSLSGILPPEVVAQCVRCGDLLVPPGTPPPGGWPVVVLAHSGGFAFGSKDDGRMAFWAEELAAAGFASLAVNYALAEPEALRPFYNVACDIDADGSTGGPVCGQPLHDAIDAMRTDLQAAVRWLRMTTAPTSVGGLDNPHALNPDAIGILGESAGATGALEVMTRPDAPATVGVTGPSAAVQATVAIAGFQDDASQDPGEGPALLMTYTHDPLGELFGFDMYDEGREVLARADQTGNAGTNLTSYCTRLDIDGNGTLDPQHLAGPGTTDLTDQVARAVAFFRAELAGPPKRDAQHHGASGSVRDDPFPTAPRQALVGDHEPVVGDFDGDGADDLYLYGPGATCDTVWLGRPDRTFSDPDELQGGALAPVAAQDAEAVADVGDLDGDGLDDIVWYEPATTQIQLWYGGAGGTFDRRVLGPSTADQDITIGDFDGDGLDDLLLDTPTASNASVAFSTPVRGVLDLAYESAKVPTQRAFVGDMDGDGRDDVLWYDPTSGLDLTRWLATPGRSFAVAELVDLIPDIQVALADVNGDGTADPTLYAGALHLTITFAGLPGGGFALVAGRILGDGLALGAGDVDGDGFADLIWTGATGTEVAFGAAVGSPLFTDLAVAPANPAGQPEQGDFDGDGRVDRVWATTG